MAGEPVGQPHAVPSAAAAGRLAGLAAEGRARQAAAQVAEEAEPDLLDDILGRVQFPASARLIEERNGTWIAESGTLRTVFVDDGTPSNAAPLGWMRGVIGEALLPLHQAYPLGEVEFRG